MCWRICILITQTPKDKFRKYICCAVAKKERNWFYIQIFIGNACSSDAAYLQQGKIKIACDVKSSVKTECVYVCRSVVQIAARHRGQISNQDREKSSTYSLIKKKIQTLFIKILAICTKNSVYHFLLKDCQFRKYTFSKADFSQEFHFFFHSFHKVIHFVVYFLVWAEF